MLKIVEKGRNTTVITPWLVFKKYKHKEHYHTERQALTLLKPLYPIYITSFKQLIIMRNLHLQPITHVLSYNPAHTINTIMEVYESVVAQLSTQRWNIHLLTPHAPYFLSALPTHLHQTCLAVLKRCDVLNARANTATHSDLNVNNVQFSQTLNSVVLIDYEFVSAGHTMNDVASLAFQIFLLSQTGSQAQHWKQALKHLKQHVEEPAFSTFFLKEAFAYYALGNSNTLTTLLTQWLTDVRTDWVEHVHTLLNW